MNLEFIDIITLQELQFVVDNSVSIEKFTDSFDIIQLSYEPIYKFSNIITRDGKRYISFNRKKSIK